MSNQSNNESQQLQNVIDDHIKTRESIYQELTNNESNSNVNSALTTLFTSTTTTENNKLSQPTELLALINTTLSELSPLARKTKYIEIQENFAKYYTNTYQANKQIIDTYSAALDKLNTDLQKQQNDITELTSELDTAKRGKSTYYRQMTSAKYNLEEAQYYKRLYLVYMITLLLLSAIVVIMGKPILGIIGRTMCIMITTTVTVLLAMYTIYYVYFKHPIRDIAVWRKYRWSSSATTNMNCSNNKPNTENDVENRAANIAASSM